MMIDLDERTKNVIRAEFGRLVAPEELAKLSEIELLRIPNMGKRSTARIVEWLAAHGLKLDKYGEAEAEWKARQEARRLREAEEKAAREAATIARYIAYLEKRGYTVKESGDIKPRYSAQFNKRIAEELEGFGDAVRSKRQQP